MANRLTAWWRRVARAFQGMTAEEHIGVRTQARMGTGVTPDTALRNSAVWACLRLRADLISTFPVDVFRKVGESRLEVPTPPVLREPGGPMWDYPDWMYATQFDLDRSGNAFGLVTARDGGGRPAVIEPVALGDVTVIQRADTGQIVYRIGKEEYTPEQVWHERQFVVAGLPVGLSPVAYAAWVISESQSIQQFAESWFSRGAVPSAHLKNSEVTVTAEQASAVKERFTASVQAGDPFVSGKDWEYHPLRAESMGMEWLEDRKHSLTDIARFFGCPADLIDAAVSGSSVTYANITERNLQFLIMHLGPAVARREKNLTKLVGESRSRSRFVKLNTDALLRMDPVSRANAIKVALDGRWLTPTEARALEDRPPLTPEQVAEFDALYGPPRSTPQPAAVA